MSSIFTGLFLAVLGIWSWLLYSYLWRQYLWTHCNSAMTLLEENGYAAQKGGFRAMVVYQKNQQSIAWCGGMQGENSILKNEQSKKEERISLLVTAEQAQVVIDRLDPTSKPQKQ